MRVLQPTHWLHKKIICIPIKSDFADLRMYKHPFFFINFIQRIYDIFIYFRQRSAVAAADDSLVKN